MTEWLEKWKVVKKIFKCIGKISYKAYENYNSDNNDR